MLGVGACQSHHVAGEIREVDRRALGHLPDHRLPNRIEQPILAAEVVIDLRLVGVGVTKPYCDRPRLTKCRVDRWYRPSYVPKYPVG